MMKISARPEHMTCRKSGTIFLAYQTVLLHSNVFWHVAFVKWPNVHTHLRESLYKNIIYKLYKCDVPTFYLVELVIDYIYSQFSCTFIYFVGQCNLHGHTNQIWIYQFEMITCLKMDKLFKWYYQPGIYFKRIEYMSI